jgi:hypothetical protein
MLSTNLKQNYFQYSDQLFQPKKGTAMGSPISGTMAEVYLQYIEETHVKQWLDSKEIIHYKRYVDDILIIYDQNKRNKQIILHQINNIDKNFQFKMLSEENSTINYLDISTHRNNSNIDICIYRKPTGTDTTIQLSSNYPHEQKTAAFTDYINRMITMPITEQSKQDEWKTILTMARNNGYPTNIINNLKKKLIAKKQKQQQPATISHNKKMGIIHLL